MIITSLSLSVCLKGICLLSSITFYATGRNHLLSQTTSLIKIAKFRAIVCIPDLALKFAASLSEVINNSCTSSVFSHPFQLMWCKMLFLSISFTLFLWQCYVYKRIQTLGKTHPMSLSILSSSKENQELCLTVYLLQPEDKYYEPVRKEKWVFYHWQITEELCR